MQINGLDNLRQTALVLTQGCDGMRYETDRRATARAAIDQALDRYASAFPGGLAVDIQPLSVRVRCHRSGLSDLQSYCAADASLAMSATGRGAAGGAVTAAAQKTVSERAQQGLLCISVMPAVTAAVDKVVADSIAELQGDLTQRTGIPNR